MLILTRGLDVCRWISISLLLALAATIMTSQKAYGQGLEFSGGWAHVTSNHGTDGYEVGLAWWLNRRVSLAANYDATYDTSSLTNFAPTSLGLISTKSHMQNALIGPRVFFTSSWTDRHKLNPFAEIQFGETWLNQTVSVPNNPDSSASDHNMSWMLGGGAEYLLSPHLSARLNLGLLRSHLADQGQSQLRMVLGITYTTGKRSPG
jgi:hypothetical protein